MFSLKNQKENELFWNKPLSNGKTKEFWKAPKQESLTL